MRYQSYAYGSNHFALDPDLQVILGHFWPGFANRTEALMSFGEVAGGEAYRVADHVDRESPPVLVMHDLDGERVDRARLAPAHEALMQRLAAINRPPYQPGGSWHEHFALGYLLSDPGLYCILIITNQVAYAIHKYAPEHAAWKDRLLSGEAWGATWMTEQHAGSDLGACRTVAMEDGDVWRLTGEKYFASGAGLADVAIVTARPEGGPEGPKGVALFLLPRLAQSGELNFTVRRLKDKSATRAVPTGEVDLAGAEAYLIGKAELGIYYTLENLTVSRLANSAGAMGIARKAQLEALGRVRAREAFGRPIVEHPLVRRDLVDLAVRTAGGLALTFRAVDAFDAAWRDEPPYGPGYHYARLLAHLAKGRTADHAAECTRTAMELFGGLGFMEDYAIARWHREALVTPIWEGTANIQALDMAEALLKKHAAEQFVSEFAGELDRAGTEEAALTRQRIDGTLGQLPLLGREEQQWYAKEALVLLADAAQVALLYRLAQAGGERYAKLAALYARRFLARGEYPSWAMADADVWGGVQPEPTEPVER